MTMKTCSHCEASIDARGLKAHELKCEKTLGDGVSSVEGTPKEINPNGYAFGEQSPQCDSDNSLAVASLVVTIGAGFFAILSYLKKGVQGA